MLLLAGGKVLILLHINSLYEQVQRASEERKVGKISKKHTTNVCGGSITATKKNSQQNQANELFSTVKKIYDGKWGN